ncbi:MAG: FecR domain-containing protein [Spirochaetes bacterium]|nr:FecR domain-containing protein [Spirochaetota bacterium]
MKPFIFCLAVLVCLSAIGPLTVLGENGIDEEVGKITYIIGTCRIKGEDGEYGDASVDLPVRTSDTVQTLSASEAEITLDDGNLIRLTEDSEITIDNWQLREETRTNISLLFGSVKLAIGRFRKGKDEFSVNTATVLAGVRGTEFDVSLREDGEVLINVEEGSIETDYDGDTHTITKGNASRFPIQNKRQDFKGRIDKEKWRREAIERIKEDPEAFLQRLLVRERLIIMHLKQNEERMEQFRKDFAAFLKRTRYLHEKKLYRQERVLIIAQMEKTKKALGFFITARRQLTGIRSLMVIAARIEAELDPAAREDLASLQEIRREYGRMSVAIKRLDEAQKKLRGVLFMLNKRLDELNTLLGEPGAKLQ